MASVFSKLKVCPGGMRGIHKSQKANKTYMSQESHKVTSFTGSIPKVTKLVNSHLEEEPHQRS